MTGGYNNKTPASFDTLFDPDIVGDGPAATHYAKVGGALLQYANIKYGAKGPDLNYRDPGGVDLSNKWAAKGTAVYSLSIQGQKFPENALVASKASGSATLTFGVFNGTWSVTGSGSGTLNPAAGTQASGAVPTGAVTVQYTATLVSNSGSPASTSSNGAATKTAISSNPTVSVTTGGTGTQPGNVGTYNMTVVFYNASGTAISTTAFQFAVGYDGSA